MAVKTRNQENGTWLIPIVEGASPQVSPPDKTTEYRVAESRKFYNKVASAREERRTWRAFSEQGDKLAQSQQEQIIDAPAIDDGEWPDAIVAYSSAEEVDDEVDIDVIVSPHLIDSPPSAPGISPPFTTQ